MTTESTGRIFINYRRQDTAWQAVALYHRLAERFGEEQIFKDVDNIRLGDDFVQKITEEVEACDILLALIGHHWLDAVDERGTIRLDDPEDFVRLEIEAALKRNVMLIPVLVDGASMPTRERVPPSLEPLIRRQALELNPNRFSGDTDELLEVLESTLTDLGVQADQEFTRKLPRTAGRPSRRSGHNHSSTGRSQLATHTDDRSASPVRRRWFAGIAASVLVMGVAISWFALRPDDSQRNPAANGESAHSPDQGASPERTGAAPSVGDRALQLGQTRHGEEVETTLVKVKDNWTKGAANQQVILDEENADRWFAVFARRCAVGNLSEPIEVLPQDFSLGTSSGAVIQTPSSYDENFPSPRFPDTKLRSGCREGWINFALEDGVKVDRVYATDFLNSDEPFAEWRF